MSGFDLVTKYSRQLYIFLAMGSQNLGRLNMRLSEVLSCIIASLNRGYKT